MRKNDPIRKQIDADKAADKRLADAAPELLRVLKNLVEAVWDGRLEELGAEEFTDPARRAIKKAEGK